MIVVGLTDIHGDLDCVERMASVLAAADLVLIAGDLTHFGGAREAGLVLEKVRRHAKAVLAVPGNCDLPEVGDFLAQAGVGIHGCSQVVGGIAFAGVGASLPSPGKTPNETTEEGLGSCLAEAMGSVPSGMPVVLVCHQPPLDTVNDALPNGLHVGSSSVRQAIEKTQPMLCLTGHIHEGVGLDAIGATRTVNPGPLPAGGYMYAELTQKLNTLEIRHLPT
jgi:Icc-related predicted phosphoesterase